MKSAKTQNKTTSSTHPPKPFFNKTGEGSFFSQKKAQEAEKPFFGPNHIQAKEGRIVQHRILSPDEIRKDERNEERRKARELEIEQSIKIVDGWKLLGQEKYKWGSQRVVQNFYVGTEEQWRKVLAKADDKDVYYKYVNPFLQLVENPNIVDGWTRNHMRSEYKSTVLRSPNNDEIMAFMRALYTHSNLDIRQSWSGGNIHHATITRSFAHIIKRYQAQVIREISLKGTTAGKHVLDEKAIRAIAEEGKGTSRINMIKSAIVSANEGLAKLILAYAQKNEADKSNMYQLISNAGSLIRQTLNVHKEELKKEEQLNTLILDLVLDVTKLDEIPGVQTILRRIPTIKTILKKNASKMLNAGSQGSSPYTQAYKIVAEFEETARKFGPTGNPNEVGKLLDANSERIAINTFKTSMGIK